MIIGDIKDLSLGETLDCGQAFRWKENEDGSFTGVAFGRLVTFSLSGSELTIDGADEKDRTLWSDYFDLSLDYGSVRDELSLLHPTMREAAKYAPGIRILAQDPWEALCSFVISQNNNIPRIKLIINRLCETFGEPVADGWYTFPSAEKIAALEPDELAPIKAGFRSRYIIDAARKTAGG